MSSYNGCFLKKRKKVKEKNLVKYGELTCEYCGKSPLQKVNQNNHNFCTIDHFVPLNKGGDNSWENLYVTCLECNRQKGDLHPSEFSTNYYFIEHQKLSTSLPTSGIQTVHKTISRVRNKVQQEDSSDEAV